MKEFSSTDRTPSATSLFRTRPLPASELILLPYRSESELSRIVEADDAATSALRSSVNEWMTETREKRTPHLPSLVTRFCEYRATLFDTRIRVFRPDFINVDVVLETLLSDASLLTLVAWETEVEPRLKFFEPLLGREQLSEALAADAQERTARLKSQIEMDVKVAILRGELKTQTKAAGNKKPPPKRVPDIEGHREKLKMIEHLQSELATILNETRRYTSVKDLRTKFPDFKIWEELSNQEAKELLTEDFKPTVYAQYIVLRKHGLTGGANTVKSWRRKVRQADSPPSQRP